MTQVQRIAFPLWSLYFSGGTRFQLSNDRSKWDIAGFVRVCVHVCLCVCVSVCVCVCDF